MAQKFRDKTGRGCASYILGPSEYLRLKAELSSITGSDSYVLDDILSLGGIPVVVSTSPGLSLGVDPRMAAQCSLP